MMLIALLVSFGFNVALFVAYLLLNKRYEDEKATWAKLESQFDAEKELAVAAVHMQWKQYVDKIHPPGQA